MNVSHVVFSLYQNQIRSSSLTKNLLTGEIKLGRMSRTINRVLNDYSRGWSEANIKAVKIQLNYALAITYSSDQMLVC